MSETGNGIVQGLWIGPSLSTMERLSISSFLANGHPYHLYAYDEIEGVPAGAILKDANQILPASRVFRYSSSGSYAGFSNVFRYRLLLERGNWWADLDMVCLRPFRFPESPVISSEHAEGCRYVNVGVLRFEPGHAAMDAAVRICDAKDPQTTVPFEIGPGLMDWLVRKFSLAASVRDPEVFCPIPCHRFDWLTEPGGETPESAYAVHLWHEVWRRRGLDKDAQYPGACLYERLKSMYLDQNG